MIVEKEFYLGNDVIRIAQGLLGKVLYTRVNGELTSGIIVETEAYRGATDRASHAFPNRKTKRNRIMFEEGGRAYVYMIYGIYFLFNIVTNKTEIADAILIRALEPVEGLKIMMGRRNKNNLDRITSGPGILSQAMGIDLNMYGEDLTGSKIWLEYPEKNQSSLPVTQTYRIGVDYAGEDSKLPWRFYFTGNPWVSKL